MTDDDDRLDARLREAADAYHRPPARVPRDEMWAAIVASRGARATPLHVGSRTPWWLLAAAAVVLIGVGIAIGRRLPIGARAGSTVAAAPSPAASDSASAMRYRVATAEYLTHVEALLVAFRNDAAQGRTDAQLSSWAQDLLTTTRLLLDSPAGQDPMRRQLLSDLELVLAQIVQLAPGAPARERALIDGALTEDQILARLRAALPASQRGA
jgi:hypothetical protein